MANGLTQRIYVEDPVATPIPPWLSEVTFCHILLDDDSGYYCGAPGWENGPTCEDYDGEAICPSCGNPTCPCCAQLSDLEERLDDDA